MWWLWFSLALGLPVIVAPAVAGVTGWPINSCVTRLMVVFGGGVLLAKLGGARRNLPPDLGRGFRTALIAMAVTIGFCVLYSVGLILAQCESVRPFEEIFKPSRLLTALATGLAVSAIEEPFFRRYLLTRFSYGGQFATGAILSSAAYALVHYVRPDKVPLQDSYTIGDAWGVYQNLLTNLLKPFQDPAPGIGLFLLGLVLCVVVRRGGLAWTIGIHSGVVYYVKADACLIYWNHHGRHPWFGSSDVLYDGRLFWVVCAAVLLVLLVVLRRRPE